jgi:hypothetical protein
MSTPIENLANCHTGAALLLVTYFNCPLAQMMK